MHEIIERSLKEDLNQVHLKELVKNDFLRRKVKMNSMDKLLDHRIFEKIYQDSLLSVFRDIVQQELFPIKKKLTLCMLWLIKVLILNSKVYKMSSKNLKFFYFKTTKTF